MDAEALKDTLRALTDALPLLPERIGAVADEAEAVQTAADEFRGRMDSRLAEALDLLGRIEAAVTGLRDESSSQAIAFAEHADLAAGLDDPALGFPQTVAAPTVELLRRHEAALDGFASAFADRRTDHAATLGGATAALQHLAIEGRQRLESAAEQALLQAATLQAAVSATQASLAEEVERLRAGLEDESAQSSHEMDEMARDMDAIEAALVAALERTRESLRVNMERVADETGTRLTAADATLAQRLAEATDAIHELDILLRKSAEDTAEACAALGPRFDELESRLAPLKQAVESVREAAASVGIAF